MFRNPSVIFLSCVIRIENISSAGSSVQHIVHAATGLCVWRGSARVLLSLNQM